MDIILYSFEVESCNWGPVATRELRPLVMQKTNNTVEVLFTVLIEFLQEFTIWLSSIKLWVQLGFGTYVVRGWPLQSRGYHCSVRPGCHKESVDGESFLTCTVVYTDTMLYKPCSGLSTEG